MKIRILAIVAALAFLVSTPTFAEDDYVSKTTLRSLGLSGIRRMSDAEGMLVRGRLTGSGMVIGTSLISFQVMTPDTNNFVNGNSINEISGDVQFGDSNEQISKTHSVAISPAIVLNTNFPDAVPNNVAFIATVVGQIHGTGSVKLGFLQ